MYTLVLVFVSLSGLLSVTMGQSDEIDYKMMKLKTIAEECIRYFPLKKIQEEITPDGPKSEQGKCFYKCMLTKAGVIDEDGNLEKFNLFKVITVACGGREDCIKKLGKLTDECNNERDESQCGSAWKKMNCVKKLISSVGDVNDAKTTPDVKM